jgi:hypothetical protein
LNLRLPALHGLRGGLVLLLAFCASALPGEVVSREYQLKAVYIYHFTEFVDWPKTAFSTPDSPIVIGVLGPDPFAGHLEQAIRDERVRNRRLIIQRYQRVQEVENCHLLFISASENARLEGILAELKGRSILTVGETEDFALRGGMIQFIKVENRIRFRVNLGAARAAKIQISSKILRSAEVLNAGKE